MLLKAMLPITWIYSRVSAEVLSRSGIRLIDPQQILYWSELLVDQLLFFCLS